MGVEEAAAMLLTLVQEEQEDFPEVPEGAEEPVLMVILQEQAETVLLE